MLRSFKTLGLFLLVASAAPVSAQTDIHGTWTAEIRQGKVFLQVRTTPPADWNRSGNGNGDWNMKQAGFGGASVEDLVRAKDHGVTPEFVQEIKGMGLTVTGLDQYIRLRDHGVKGDFAKELKAAGYDKLSAEELVRVRDHGVTALYVRDLAAQGVKDVPLEDLIRMKDHGVSADYIADMDLSVVASD